MELFRAAGVEPLIREAASVLADNHGILQADTLTGDDQEWLFKEIDPGGGAGPLQPVRLVPVQPERPGAGAAARAPASSAATSASAPSWSPSSRTPTG